jgi:poly(A) polymerase
VPRRPRLGPLARLLRRARRRRPAPLRPWPELASFGPRPTGGVLVGGALRDALLGRVWTDVDWLAPDPAGGAEQLARRLDGHAFALDPDRGHWRVVTNGGTIDLTPLAGPVPDELARRDFTVNAMALGEAGPIDPLDGRADLAARRLVAAGPSALADDPLRGLRGVRLAASHELAWEEASRAQAAAVARELAAGERALPAAERMRDELTALLHGPRPGDALADAHALGWLALLLPELVEGEGVEQGGLHHLDVLDHQLEALQRLASGFPDADLPLRLATLLHDVGKPACREREPGGRWRFHGHAERGAELAERALRRLRYDRATVARTAELVRRHMLPLPRDEREARRFVHRRRVLLPDLLKLMIADREAARGRLASAAGRRRYREALGQVLALLAEAPPEPPLLDGRAVMDELGIGPGPRVGEALRFLAEARAVGDVADREEARAALRRYAAVHGWTEATAE